MTIFDPKWKKIKKRLIKDLKQINKYHFTRILDSFHHFHEVLLEFQEVFKHVNSIVKEAVMDTGFLKNNYSEYQQEWEAYRRLSVQLDDHLNYYYNDLLKISRGQKPNWATDHLRDLRKIKQSSFLVIIADIENANQQNLLEKLRIDEKREIFGLRDVEKHIFELQNRVHNDFAHFIRVMDIMTSSYEKYKAAVKEKHSHDWTHPQYEDLPKYRKQMKRIHNNLLHEFNITAGYFHRFRRMVTARCNEALKELEALNLQ